MGASLVFAPLRPHTSDAVKSPESRRGPGRTFPAQLSPARRVESIEAKNASHVAVHGPAQRGEKLTPAEKKELAEYRKSIHGNK